MTISCLEDLPNELILDILSFVSYIDVHRGFINLNMRFSKILNDVHPSIRIVATETEEEMEAINYFASQVYYLSTMGKPRDLTSFINLRSFIDYDSSSDHVSLIDPERFPYLQRLHLNCRCTNVVEKIFSSKVNRQFPNLTWCRIPVNSFVNFLSLRSCTNLRSLELDGSCDTDMLLQILTLVPQLHYLKIKLYANTFDDFISKPLICSTLECLFIKIHCLNNDIYLHENYILWSLFPRVKRVMIQVHFIEKIDFNRFHQCIMIAWPYLSHLDYKITFVQNYMSRFDIERLRASLPLFNEANIRKDSNLVTVFKYKTSVEWQKDYNT